MNPSDKIDYQVTDRLDTIPPDNSISLRDLPKDDPYTLLYQTSTEVLRQYALNDSLITILSNAATIAKAAHGNIYLVNRRANVLEAVAGIGIGRKYIGTQCKFGENFLGKVWESTKPNLVNSFSANVNHTPDYRADNISSALFLPLISKQHVTGVMVFYFQDACRNISQEEVTFLERFAELAHLSARRTRMNSLLQHTLSKRERIAKKALHKSKEKYRALINVIPDLILRIDRNGFIFDALAAKDCVPIMSPSDLAGKHASEIWPPEIFRQYMYYLEKALQTGETQVFEYKIMVNDQLRDRESRIVVSGNNEFLAIIRDITTRKQMEEQLTFLSMHDALTGLYNRAYFQQEMHRLESGRYNPVGVIICDVNDLKVVNDILGHEYGDKLLIATANLLKSCLRGSDIVARIGGDEFAILLPQNDQADVDRVCARIVEATDLYSKTNPQTPLGVSIGSSVGDGYLNMTALFTAADDQMYRKKLQTRSNNTIYNGIIAAYEAKEFIHNGHTLHIQNLALKLAHSAEMPQERLSNLELLIKFHDIGNIGVSDDILLKADNLIQEEVTAMRRHTEIGHRIAKSTTLLTPIADLILAHHEWWNGRGYPLGLKSEEIPLECRILSIVDTYDSLTNRHALSPANAIAEIEKNAGEQFDPWLVDKFAEIINNDTHSIP